MRKFYLFGLALLISFALLTASVTLTAQRQPVSRVLQQLRLTDCAPPCWMGIEPGKTTLTEARKRIVAAFGSDDSGYILDFEETTQGRLLWISLERQRDPFGVVYIMMDGQYDDRIDVISFNFNSVYVKERATFVDFLRIFGSPSRIKISDRTIGPPDGVGLVYGNDERGYLLSVLNEEPPKWTHFVERVTYFGNGQLPLPLSAELRSWRGFRSTYRNRR